MNFNFILICPLGAVDPRGEKSPGTKGPVFLDLNADDIIFEENHIYST